MTRVAAVLPGYATVAHSSGVLHLAPRSVRDLIYSGRLPSLRIGRLHYVRAADLELERRRRLGLRLPSPSTRTTRASRTATPGTDLRPRAARGSVDPAVRRRRAAERSELVSRWAERHHLSAPELPFASVVVGEAAACESCGRRIRAGARAVQPVHEEGQLCLTCGRRVLLDWADHRRLEAAAARRMAQALASSTPAAA